MHVKHVIRQGFVFKDVSYVSELKQCWHFTTYIGTCCLIYKTGLFISDSTAIVR